MLYRICKRLIERGQTAGLAEKLMFLRTRPHHRSRVQRADRAAGPAGNRPWHLMPTLGHWGRSQ